MTAEDPTDVPGGEADLAPEDPVSAIAPVTEPSSFTSPSFSPPGGAGAAATPHPEVAIGAAFAGGFIAAMLLKRLGN